MKLHREQKLDETFTYRERSLDVVGSTGKLIISDNCDGRCGGKTGFHLGVTWGKYGEAGGILPQEEAKELAEHILGALDRK